MDFEPYEVSVELSETPQIDIDKIAEQVIGDPVSATVSKEDGKTIIPEKVGVQFDVEEARTIIGDGSAASYEIPVTTTAAKVTAESWRKCCSGIRLRAARPASTRATCRARTMSVWHLPRSTARF